MFQFTGYNSPKSDRITSTGLPHSGIHESKPACGSSWLIAAFRALLRPNTPRHPPYALDSFTLHLFPRINFQLILERILMCSISCAIFKELLVGLGRLELPTSRLSGVRSNRLSYRPFGDEEI